MRAAANHMQGNARILQSRVPMGRDSSPCVLAERKNKYSEAES